MIINEFALLREERRFSPGIDQKKSQDHHHGQPWDQVGFSRRNDSLVAYGRATLRRMKRLPPLPLGTDAFTVSSAPWVEVICWFTVPCSNYQQRGFHSTQPDK